MKKIFISVFTVLLIFSCKKHSGSIVSSIFVDSLINNYAVPQVIKSNEADLPFWKNRILPNNPDYTNAIKYAATLIARYNLLGDIKDVKKSDSMLYKIIAAYNGKEAGPYINLVSHYILQHRFKNADSVFKLAQKIGIKQYENAAIAFDVNFEQGNILAAVYNLQSIKIENDYGYQFRKSKLMHYKGELDSSIRAMNKAAENAGPENILKMAALSNVGDLYIHDGMMNEAYNCYMQCVKANAADMHSMLGIGWVALVKDKNDSLAEKIFKFEASKTLSPDPLFKLIALAEHRNDTALQLKYAKAFQQKVTDTLYGRMYNKYLIQLYTGILNNPAKAEAIAKDELLNRTTPQTYAWYAFALLKNNKKEEAYQVYQKYVSGKPLESLELFWMGKLNQSLNKGYNAKQYFESAEKNIYDLSPLQEMDLRRGLEK